MNKITVYLLLIFSLFLLNNKAHAKNGSGEVNLSIRTASALYSYLNHKKGRPMFFAIHPSGNYYSYWYCPYEYAQGCDMTAWRELVDNCTDWAKEENIEGDCFMFARKSTIYWKNSVNKKKLKIPKKLTEDQLKQFLIDNKFLSADANTPTYNIENPDLLEKIKGLKKLYDQGAITKKDFEKAKKKLLNK